MPATNHARAVRDSAQTYAANRRSVESAYVFTVGYHWMPNGIVTNSNTARIARRRDDQRRKTCTYTMQPSATVSSTESPRRTYQELWKTCSHPPYAYGKSGACGYQKLTYGVLPCATSL